MSQDLITNMSNNIMSTMRLQIWRCLCAQLTMVWLISFWLYDGAKAMCIQ